MAGKVDFDALMSSIDTETTRIGAKFEELLAKLAAGGMTADEEAAVLAEGNRLAAKLKEIGKDPAEPVPNPEPEPGTGGGEGETAG